MKPAAVLLLPLIGFGLGACSSNSDGAAEPYVVPAQIDLSNSGTPVNTGDVAAIASTGSLLLTLTDELDDYVDDIDEWFARSSGACRSGGTVSVEQRTSAGRVSKTLRFDDCVEGDDLQDGTVVLECAATGCAGNGSIVFGAGGTPYIDQDLDGDRLSNVLLGRIDFQNVSPSRETGRLVFDLDAQFVGPQGRIGATRLSNLRYDLAERAGDVEVRSFEGQLQVTGFSTASGSCNASGTTSVSTVSELVYDDDRDLTQSGQLRFGNLRAGTLTWVGGSVTAAVDGGATQSYTEREFVRLCDF